MISNGNFAFMNLGTAELVMVVLIILLLFGAKKLPELARSAGSSMRELKKGLNEDDEKTQERTEKVRPKSVS